MFGYEKTVLYLYPYAERLKESYEALAETKKETSYRMNDAVKVVQEVITAYGIANNIDVWRKATDDILLELSEEEKCLLEYRFFRRKKYLMGKYYRFCFPFSYTSFFRRIRALTKKVSEMFGEAGFTEKKFLDNFSDCGEIMTAYRNVELGKDECLLRGKPCSFQFSLKPCSS